MRFDWNEYLEFAKKLKSINPSTQLNLRNAISRAYYASYHKCRIYKGILKNSPEVHKELIEELRRSDDHREIQIAYILYDLRKERNDADYESNIEFRKVDVDKRFEEVDLIFDNIKDLQL